MKSDKYCMAFSTGHLFRNESVEFAKLYNDMRDWGKVKDIVISGNLLQVRTINSSKRLCREIISRLQTLTAEELDYFIRADQTGQGYILWIAVCRRYKFIADFAAEILRERYVTLKNDLSNDDFDAFFNKKSEWHNELDKISQSTRKKLRQVLFRMMHEADLLDLKNEINAAMLTTEFISVVGKKSYHELLYFPVFESDLKGLLQ